MIPDRGFQIICFLLTFCSKVIWGMSMTEDVKLKVGENFKFSCSVKNTAADDIQIMKNQMKNYMYSMGEGMMLSTGTRMNGSFITDNRMKVTKTPNSNELSLQILGVQSGDEGHYSCRVKGTNVTHQNSLLSVMGPPHSISWHVYDGNLRKLIKLNNGSTLHHSSRCY
ncbi:uncharacterized protein LOC141913676 [Tubulanus polymorphus]|uniref:uncharacterized protein LOC141913676 n=1 Tax=Tubulanus polymorphus TaxID=672921 RepID=UPI003DA23E84